MKKRDDFMMPTAAQMETAFARNRFLHRERKSWQNLFEYVEGCELRDKNGIVYPEYTLDTITFAGHDGCACRIRTVAKMAEEAAEVAKELEKARLINWERKP